MDLTYDRLYQAQKQFSADLEEKYVTATAMLSLAQAEKDDLAHQITELRIQFKEAAPDGYKKLYPVKEDK